MTAMPISPGRGTRASLAAVVGFGWLLLGLAAWIYARMQRVPEWASLPIAAAFLIEFPFYILPGFEAPRAWLAGKKKPFAAWLLTASAIAPWLVYSIATGEARLQAFVLLLAVPLAVSLWYIVLPAKPVSDALFLIVIAAIYLSKIFDRIYLSPIPRLQLSVLGHLMLIRTAATAVLILRGNVTAEFRLIPNRKEWWTGFRYFAMMLPIVSLVYWALGLVKLRPHPNGIGLTVLLAIGTFFGVLWVVALSEEFFFRGLLQQWIESWTGKPLAALIAASILFGCAHLGFHRIFPNWRWAIVATILGIFSGLAWRDSRSVQAAMVTHTLIVTLWLVFFQIR
jgi:membrane protease YdiL (CAAX protease family)